MVGQKHKVITDMLDQIKNKFNEMDDKFIEEWPIFSALFCSHIVCAFEDFLFKINVERSAKRCEDVHPIEPKIPTASVKMIPKIEEQMTTICGSSHIIRSGKYEELSSVLELKAMNVQHSDTTKPCPLIVDDSKNDEAMENLRVEAPLEIPSLKMPPLIENASPDKIQMKVTMKDSKRRQSRNSMEKSAKKPKKNSDLIAADNRMVDCTTKEDSQKKSNDCVPKEKSASNSTNKTGSCSCCRRDNGAHSKRCSMTNEKKTNCPEHSVPYKCDLLHGSNGFYCKTPQEYLDHLEIHFPKTSREELKEEYLVCRC